MLIAHYLMVNLDEKQIEVVISETKIQFMKKYLYFES